MGTCHEPASDLSLYCSMLYPKLIAVKAAWDLAYAWFLLFSLLAGAFHVSCQ